MGRGRCRRQAFLYMWFQMSPLSVSQSVQQLRSPLAQMDPQEQQEPQRPQPEEQQKPQEQQKPPRRLIQLWKCNSCVGGQRLGRGRRRRRFSYAMCGFGRDRWLSAATGSHRRSRSHRGHSHRSSISHRGSEAERQRNMHGRRARWRSSKQCRANGFLSYHNGLVWRAA